MVVLCLLPLIVTGCLSGPAGDGVPIESYELDTPEPTTEPTPADPPSRFVTFLALDAGESSLVHNPSADDVLLIDTGGDPDASTVRAALDERDVDEVDILFTTGVERAQIGGAAAVVEAYAPSPIGFSGVTVETEAFDAYLRAAVRTDVHRELTAVDEGLTFTTSGDRWRVLAPPDELLADGEPEQNRLVLSYTVQDTRFLWLGDPGEEQVDWLHATYGDDLAADVLVLSAGAEPPSAILGSVDPHVVIVEGPECHAATAMAVESADGVDATVYRTATDGTVTVEVDADGPAIRTEEWRR